MTNRQGHFTRSGAIQPLRRARLLVAEGSGLHPVPPITVGVWLLCRLLTSVPSRRRCRKTRCPSHLGSGGDSSAFALALSPAPMATTAPLGFDGDSSPFGLALSSTPIAHGPLVRQISPDKDMNFQCTTAAFTLSPAPDGLRHLVLTRPGTKPSMRFLSVGSHLCAQASSRHPLAGLPLPSASSYMFKGHYRYSYRGLSPHQFTPMPGVRPSRRQS
jgi:hypothetical protein